MAIVIKEIIVKTEVGSRKKELESPVVPDEWMERIKEEVLKEIGILRTQDGGRKER